MIIVIQHPPSLNRPPEYMKNPYSFVSISPYGKSHFQTPKLTTSIDPRDPASSLKGGYVRDETWTLQWLPCMGSRLYLSFPSSINHVTTNPLASRHSHCPVAAIGNATSTQLNHVTLQFPFLYSMQKVKTERGQDNES